MTKKTFFQFLCLFLLFVLIVELIPYSALAGSMPWWEVMAESFEWTMAMTQLIDSQIVKDFRSLFKSLVYLATGRLSSFGGPESSFVGFPVAPAAPSFDTSSVTEAVFRRTKTAKIYQLDEAKRITQVKYKNPQEVDVAVISKVAREIYDAANLLGFTAEGLRQFLSGNIVQLEKISSQSISDTASISRPLNDDILYISQPECVKHKKKGWFKTKVKIDCVTYGMSADGRVGSAKYHKSKSSFGGILGGPLVIAFSIAIPYFSPFTLLVGTISGSIGGLILSNISAPILQNASTPQALGTVESSNSLGVGKWTWRGGFRVPEEPVNVLPDVLPGDFSLSLGGSVACNFVPLSWTSSSGAQAYRILRGSPRVDISPYQPYTALNFTDTTVSQNTTYPYQIEAYNSAGTNRSNVLNVTTPYCPPTVDIKANGSDGPISIYQGQSVTLSWSSAYSTSMMGSMMGDISKELSASVSSLFSAASGGWGGSMLLNGSKVVVPLPPSATFTLTGSGPGGSASDSVTINISPLLLPDWREIIPR